MQRSLCSLLVLITMCGGLCGNTSAQTRNGVPPFGTAAGGPETINLANLNVDLNVPIRSKPGRGTNFTYALNYDSLIWTPVASGGTTSWQPSSQWGWSGLQPAGLSFVTYSMVYTSGNCGYMGQSSYQEWQFSNFAYYDSFGVWHSFPNVGGVYFISPGGNCPPNGAQPPQSSQTATDGSAYTLYVNIGQFPTVYLTDKNGNTINVQSGTTQPSSGDTSTSDRNGNLISQHNGVYTDTLGTNALSVVASANTTFSYAAPSGATTRSKNGRTALIRACDYPDPAIIRSLINHGVNVNIVDKDGRTALMEASLHGDLEVVELLVSAGARASLADAEGRTARNLALEAKHEEVARFLEGLP